MNDSVWHWIQLTCGKSKHAVNAVELHENNTNIDYKISRKFMDGDQRRFRMCRKSFSPTKGEINELY